VGATAFPAADILKRGDNGVKSKKATSFWRACHKGVDARFVFRRALRTL
jgi:hypothetical protein